MSNLYKRSHTRETCRFSYVRPSVCRFVRFQWLCYTRSFWKCRKIQTLLQSANMKTPVDDTCSPHNSATVSCSSVSVSWPLARKTYATWIQQDPPKRLPKTRRHIPDDRIIRNYRHYIWPQLPPRVICSEGKGKGTINLVTGHKGPERE